MNIIGWKDSINITTLYLCSINQTLAGEKCHLTSHKPQPGHRKLNSLYIKSNVTFVFVTFRFNMISNQIVEKIVCSNF